MVQPGVVEVVRSARVEATPEQVWAVVSDARRAPDWFSPAERTDVLAGSGLGERRRQHGTWGGRRSEIEQEVVAHEPGALIAWKHTAERVDGRAAAKYAASAVFRVELRAEGTGTLVTLRSVQRPVSFLHGLGMRVGTRYLARALEESLVRLSGAVDS